MTGTKTNERPGTRARVSYVRTSAYKAREVLDLIRGKSYAEASEILDFSELHDFINSPIRTYSSGMVARLGFSVAVAVDPDVLMIDEILAVGDMHFRRKCVEKIWEYKNGAPLWGGVLTTSGGLVFTGTPEGYLKAFDAETGKELWKFQTGSGVVGCPVTWEMDGEQYLAVASGWGGAVPLWGGEVAKKVKYLNQGGSVWVFKLPKELASRN